MIRHLSRFSRLARWRYLRWVMVAPVLPFALWACNASPLQEPHPQPVQQNDQAFDLNPVRDIDIPVAPRHQSFRRLRGLEMGEQMPAREARGAGDQDRRVVHPIRRRRDCRTAPDSNRETPDPVP